MNYSDKDQEKIDFWSFWMLIKLCWQKENKKFKSSLVLNVLLALEHDEPSASLPICTPVATSGIADKAFSSWATVIKKYVRKTVDELQWRPVLTCSLMKIWSMEFHICAFLKPTKAI